MIILWEGASGLGITLLDLGRIIRERSYRPGGHCPEAIDLGAFALEPSLIGYSTCDVIKLRRKFSTFPSSL